MRSGKLIDYNTWRTFRADFSVEELEMRFRLEEEQATQNKSICNKEFFCELKKRLEEKRRQKRECK